MADEQRRLRVTIGDSTETFEVLVHSGCEPQALALAVAARAGVPPDGFFLTSSAGRGGAVVPLSATLADGTAVVLHRTAAVAPRPTISPANNHTSDRPNERPPQSIQGGAPVAMQPEALCAPLLSPSTRGSLSRGAGVVFGQVENRQLEGLERLSRLTTDLANERTLLAWVRTCLAAIRTLFAYLALVAASTGWHAALVAAEMSMATVVIATAISGAYRYFAIKAVVSQKIPPKGFGRFTIRPLVALIIVTAAATSAGVYSQQWNHAERHDG